MIPSQINLEIHIVDETRYAGVLRVLNSLVMHAPKLLLSNRISTFYARDMMSYMVALEK